MIYKNKATSWGVERPERDDVAVEDDEGEGVENEAIQPPAAEVVDVEWGHVPAPNNPKKSFENNGNGDQVDFLRTTNNTNFFLGCWIEIIFWQPERIFGEPRPVPNNPDQKSLEKTNNCFHNPGMGSWWQLPGEG